MPLEGVRGAWRGQSGEAPVRPLPPNLLASDPIRRSRKRTLETLPVSARTPWNSALFMACEVCKLPKLDLGPGVGETAGYSIC